LIKRTSVRSSQPEQNCTVPHLQLWRQVATRAGFILILAGLLVGGSAVPAQTLTLKHARTPQPAGSAAFRPVIVFMTDFGISNDAVPICKGVMLSIAPDARIVDLTHEVTPYSIFEGARYLYGTTPYFPAGTVFLAVIDPGVGSSRKALLVKSKRGQYFVLPDNGLITLVEQRDGLEGLREITNPAWIIAGARSSTFHGRDIFSPVAAHLARGDNWIEVGPEVKAFVRLPIPAAKLNSKGIAGQILAIDEPYGSLISNISAEDFRKLGYSLGEKVYVTVGSTKMFLPYVKTFSDVPLGKPLLYVDSRGEIAVAINQGSFRRKYNVKLPTSILVSRTPGK
jgi:S-adenosylmethionine hydrolase